MVGRELTKVHQEFLRGTASDVLPRLEASAKGEFTIVVGPMTKKTVSEVIGDAKVAEEFNRQTRAGATSRRAALSATAKRLGLSPKDVYAAVERTKDLGDTTK
jgi:16S rRNA (cytidine1402-2'-O)-methyltransferase